MNLPHIEQAIVGERKITGYLLSFTHRDGRTKAEFFTRFGFRVKDWEALADAILVHAAENEVSSVELSPFGKRYVIDGIIHSPDERNPLIRVVWFIRNEEEIPRFATVYPLKGKSR